MSQILIPRPSTKTLSYLELLFADCDFTFNSRLVYLRNELNRPSIKYLEDLTQQEASETIEKLKEIRRKMYVPSGRK
jgi:hypothetical protein